MQFDSLAFIAFFLAIVGLYWSVSSWVWRKNLLLLASYLFYAGWNPYFLPLLIVTSFLDWRLALLMAQASSVRSRKAWLVAICVVNLSVLAYFKYANFLIDNTNALLAMVSLPQWGFQSSIALPIGISFYTFHSLSYCIDVYRGNVQPTRSWRDYLLYVAFFPQLVAGPIVRWTTMGHQIETPRPFRPDYLGLGVALMVVGLFQKIVLADGIFAPVADAHFGQASLESGLSAWVGALAFTGQWHRLSCGAAAARARPALRRNAGRPELPSLGVCHLRRGLSRHLLRPGRRDSRDLPLARQQPGRVAARKIRAGSASAAVIW